ncbi:hypothetical protein B0T14DRAFT_106097 [Immersiella caudata]|uniref:Uncharacterized protein n=1 Tax=Immersiella caudata TaxID=314043 RepID=A0AA39X461_9PEZI|nr:hypothetical protein B0T14DRAFT_106097 [Immersiella caudata]
MEGTMFKSTLWEGGRTTKHRTQQLRQTSTPLGTLPLPAENLAACLRLPCLLLTLASCYLSLFSPLVGCAVTGRPQLPVDWDTCFLCASNTRISSFGLLPALELMLQHQSLPGSWGTRTQTGGEAPRICRGHAVCGCVGVWVRFSPTLLFETVLLPCLADAIFRRLWSTTPQPLDQGKGKMANVSRLTATDSGTKAIVGC